MIDIARDIRAILRLDLDRWRGIASLGRNPIDRRPAPDEWSALECLVHAADTEVLFGQRVRAILDGDETLPALDPDAESTPVGPHTDPVDVVGLLAERRARNDGILEIITEADLETGARHPKLGPVTLRQLLNHYAAHDLMHLVQAERAICRSTSRTLVLGGTISSTTRRRPRAPARRRARVKGPAFGLGSGVRARVRRSGGRAP